jgi:hypothetical protein
MQWRMACVVGLALTLLAGCAGGNKAKPVLGGAVFPPWGWIEYCERHPEDRDCG